MHYKLCSRCLTESPSTFRIQNLPSSRNFGSVGSSSIDRGVWFWVRIANLAEVHTAVGQVAQGHARGKKRNLFAADEPPSAPRKLIGREGRCGSTAEREEHGPFP